MSETIGIPLKVGHYLQVVTYDKNGKESWRSPLHDKNCLPIKLAKSKIKDK